LAARNVARVDPDLDLVLERERLLLTPSVRTSAAAVSALLHPDFHEFGASGRHWTRQAIIEALQTEPPGAPPPVVTDLAAVRLADTIVQVTYVTNQPDRVARRSTLWRKEADGTWLACFHQGTIVSGR
jgi:hypothetical protein